MSNRYNWTNKQLIGAISTLAAVALVGALVGCPGQAGNLRGNGQVGDSGDGVQAPVVGILNILSDAVSSENAALTILYTAPESAQSIVASYLVLSASASAGGAQIGIDEEIARDLPTGDRQSFIFDTTDLRPGFYQLRIVGNAFESFSRGTIEIQGPPSPLFIEPAEDISVTVGDSVSIVADVGDPQGQAQWRLFFVDSDAEQVQEGQLAGTQLLGRRLGEGSDNPVTFTWDTTNVDAGVYRLGLSATDSGFSVAGAVAAGKVGTIVTAYAETTIDLERAAAAADPPTFAFTSSDMTVFGEDTVSIEFNAATFEGDEFNVRIFWILEDESETIATVTDPEIGSVDFTPQDDDLASGDYQIGATISDGKNEEVEVPESERIVIRVVRPEDAEVTVSEPGVDTQVAQGDTVTIEWDSNVPPADGRFFRVFARPIASGSDIEIVDDLTLNITTTTWDTTEVRGKFEFWVEMRLPELTGTVSAKALGIVRVAITPAVVWVGSIGREDFLREGEVFQGVNFQDNAGTAVVGVGDYNNDGHDEFIITARFGKPFFQNPGGIGIGEGYLIYGTDPRNETRNLNNVASAGLKGITFTAPRPDPTSSTATDGLSAVRLIPDQDGDNKPELAFGLPFITSRGHSRRIYVDANPTAKDTLERAHQFERGGVVFVSSRNSKLSNPPDSGNPDAPIANRPVINLDLVGQNFVNTDASSACDGLFPIDQWGVQDVCCNPDLAEMPPVCTADFPVEPACVRGQADGCFETFRGSQNGFTRALADHLGALCLPFSGSGTGVSCACFDTGLGTQDCDEFHAADCGTPAIPDQGAACGGSDHSVSGSPCSIALGLTGDAGLEADDVTPVGNEVAPTEEPNDDRLGSGFYTLAGNAPLEPFGARLIGNAPGTDGTEATTGDKFGSSIAVSGGFLIISAPNRDPIAAELLQAPTGSLTDAGIMYMINMNNLWPDFDVDGSSPPLPFQYQVGPFPAPFDAIGTAGCGAACTPVQTIRNAASHCGRSSLLEAFPSPFRILGETNQQIDFVEGIPDFNLDNREDFVVGAPLATPAGGSAGDGAVNILFRRDPFLEGDYLLEKLTLDPADPERLTGIRINGRANKMEGFGEVLARSQSISDPFNPGMLVNRSVDFNGDGLDDLILGNPNADIDGDVDKGEIIIVFATADFITPLGGIDLDTLLDINQTFTLVNLIKVPRAIRIVGRDAGDRFGFNVVVAGDFNGDGVNDLLVAAPGGDPEFDSDDDGTLDTAGVDVIDPADPENSFGDGQQDDVNEDGVINTSDQLIDAGQVYLIFGNDKLVDLANDTLSGDTDGITTLSIEKLGTKSFGGLIFVGKEPGDMLGGGTTTRTTCVGAGTPPTCAGGTPLVRTFRSFGIGAAGDTDDDGFDDVLISSMLASPNGRVGAGEVYLIYGSP